MAYKALMQLRQAFAELLTERGFELRREVGGGLNAYADYESADLRLRFLDERGDPDVQIGAKYREDWFEVDLLRMLVEGQGYTTPLSIAQLAEWLVSNYDRVQVMLTAGCERTSREYRAIQSERARKLFGESAFEQ
jgi:hypothetical protein